MKHHTPYKPLRSGWNRPVYEVTYTIAGQEAPAPTTHDRKFAAIEAARNFALRFLAPPNGMHGIDNGFSVRCSISGRVMAEATFKQVKKAAPVDSPKEPECPECDRMGAVHSASQAQGDFLAWLQQEKHYVMCKRHDHGKGCYDEAGHRTCGCRADDLISVYFHVEKLLAEFHGIDLNKVEAERRALLQFLRNQQQH